MENKPAQLPKFVIIHDTERQVSRIISTIPCEVLCVDYNLERTKPSDQIYKVPQPDESTWYADMRLLPMDIAPEEADEFFRIFDNPVLYK